jgi:hypothetical protein
MIPEGGGLTLDLKDVKGISKFEGEIGELRGKAPPREEEGLTASDA